MDVEPAADKRSTTGQAEFSGGWLERRGEAWVGVFQRLEPKRALRSGHDGDLLEVELYWSVLTEGEMRKRSSTGERSIDRVLAELELRKREGNS